MAAASTDFSEISLTRQAETRGPGPSQPWTLARLLGFRFIFVYFILYGLPMPIAALPGTQWLVGPYNEACRAITMWFAEVALGTRIAVQANGSGDTTYDYVLVLVIAILSGVAAIGWSLIAGRRHPAWLTDRLRIFLRYVLGLTMVGYGLAKVLTTQFGPPGYETLLRPLGEFSPMGLLWTFMGFSKPYCIFTGGAEVVGGVLLLWRRTTTLGALVIIAVMVNVVALNFCYDVPVKLLSSHLLLMAVVLTLPDVGRLLDVLVLHRATAPRSFRVPLSSRRAEQIRPYLKAVLLVVVLGRAVHGQYEMWRAPDDTEPRLPLHGFYDVDAFYRGGVRQVPRTDDATRWKHLAIDRDDRLRIWPQHGAVQRYQVTFEPTTPRFIVVRRAGNDDRAEWTFGYTRPDEDHVIVTGALDGVWLEVHLVKRDMAKNELMSRGFHWINEVPYNR